METPLVLRSAAALADRFHMLPPGSRVLCAVSGGADSVCLLHVLLTLSQNGEAFRLYAAHYDHQLRGEESRRDARFVSDLCASLGVPLTLGSGDVAGEAARSGKGVEAAARDLRYAFLTETARTLGCDRIATAHNADDNAETLLLRLLRGTGLRGLTGIPPRRGPFVRPLLDLTRSEIEDYLLKARLPHVEDSSNGDDCFTRNRLRHQVMPLLRDFNPQLSHRLGETARSLRCDEDYLVSQARALLAGRVTHPAQGVLSVPAALLASAHEAVAIRAVRLLLDALPGGSRECGSVHLRGILALAAGDDPSARLVLHGGRTVQRCYGGLLFFPTAPGPLVLRPAPLALSGETWPDGSLWGCRCTPALCPPQPEEGTFYVSAFSGTPVLRPRQTGDRLRLPGQRTRPIKKLLIDRCVPRLFREALPVLADDLGPLAMAGLGPEVSRLAQPGQQALRIQFIPISERNDS